MVLLWGDLRGIPTGAESMHEAEYCGHTGPRTARPCPQALKALADTGDFEGWATFASALAPRAPCSAGLLSLHAARHRHGDRPGRAGRVPDLPHRAEQPHESILGTTTASTIGIDASDGRRDR
jgi:hypothetical protein